MTDPQIALLMLGFFILIVFLGFPIAFTLMAMGIGFGYYAYFDAGRMWRAFNRLGEDASLWEQLTLWIDGFLKNRIFDLFINQTYTVMSNEILTAVPLFLFMGYIVERANIVNRLFYNFKHCFTKHTWLDGSSRINNMCLICHRNWNCWSCCNVNGIV